MRNASPALRRYNSRVMWLSVVYAILLSLAVFVFRRHLLSGPLAYPLAVLPALPIIGIFATIGRYLVEEQDEYIRMLMIRQTLWASGFSLSIAMIWGFLESFELVRNVDSYYVVILWFAGLGLGGLVNRLTMGSPA